MVRIIIVAIIYITGVSVGDGWQSTQRLWTLWIQCHPLKHRPDHIHEWLAAAVYIKTSYNSCVKNRYQHFHITYLTNDQTVRRVFFCFYGWVLHNVKACNVLNACSWSSYIYNFTFSSWGNVELRLGSAAADKFLAALYEQQCNGK